MKARGEFPAPEIERDRPLMFCSRESCKREITKRDPVWMSVRGCYCSTECRDDWERKLDGAETVGRLLDYAERDIAARSRMPSAPFADLAPHQSNSQTSTASAEIVGRTMRSKMFRIYDFLREQGLYGATRSEIVDALGIPLQTVCGRVRRLYQMGRAGSNCVKGCFVACDHHPCTRINRHSGVENEVMLHEAFVRRWQGDQPRPGVPLSWEQAR